MVFSVVVAAGSAVIACRDPLADGEPTGDASNSDDVEGGDVPPFNTGIDGDVGLGTLTPEQVHVACESTLGYLQSNLSLDERLRILCTAGALLDGLVGAACEESVAVCTADEAVRAEAAEPPDVACANVDAAPNGTCTATVTQLEDCIEGMAGSAAAFTCQPRMSDVPPACIALSLLCSSVGDAARPPTLP